MEDVSNDGHGVTTTPTAVGQFALAWSGVNGAENHEVEPAERYPNLARARSVGGGLGFIEPVTAT